MKAIILLSLFYTSSSCQVQHLSEVSDNSTEQLTTTTREDILPNFKQSCVIELKLDRNIIEELNNFAGPTKNKTEYANYLSCYWKKKKLQNQNGAINFIELEKLLKYSVNIATDASDVPLLNTKPIATKIVNECTKTQGKTHGEKAVKMRNCLFGKLLQQRNTHINAEDLEDIPNLDLVEEECVNELKLNGLKIEDINRHYVVPENITEFGDFLACYWKKDNVMNNEGNFNTSALHIKLTQVVENEILARSRVRYLDDIITETIIEECRRIKGDNDGDLVLKVQNFILKRMPYFKMII